LRIRNALTVGQACFHLQVAVLRRDAGEKALVFFNTLKALADEHENDPMLQPNLLTYSGVIMVLILSSPRGGGGGGGDASSAQETVGQLLEQMKTKNGPFWSGFRSLEVLGKIKKALISSSFLSKDELIAECDRLEAVALASEETTKRSPNRR
jgi:hypothetical protein